MLASKTPPVSSHAGCVEMVRRSQPRTQTLRNGSPGPCNAPSRDVMSAASGHVTRTAIAEKMIGGVSRRTGAPLLTLAYCPRWRPAHLARLTLDRSAVHSCPDPDDSTVRDPDGPLLSRPCECRCLPLVSSDGQLAPASSDCPSPPPLPD